MAQAKRRKLYWLTEELKGTHRHHAMLLAKRGYEVMFFRRFDDLADEIRKQRVGTIIIGDEGSVDQVEHAINCLMLLPEARGSRHILSVSKHNTQLTTLAACSAFRDIIPLDIEDKQWLDRFTFATTRSHNPYPKPLPQVTFNSLASLSLPARLVWMSEDHLLFEAKVRPPRGANFALSGPFVNSIGLKTINLTVEECRRTDLIYRFSEAVLCKYSIPEANVRYADKLFHKLRQSNFGPRHKVFLAVADHDMRTSLVKELDPMRFEINIALQKHSIVHEPKYFSPNIVFIEHKLCQGAELERFQQMLDNLSPEAPVYVIGGGVNLAELQKLDPMRKIAQLSRIPKRLNDEIVDRLLPPTSKRTHNADVDAIHLVPDHPFAVCEIRCSARLKQVHPTAAALSIPINIGNYGLCKIDSPLFKKAIGYAPFAKVTETYANSREDSGNFTQNIDCYLCDVGESEQQRIADNLTAHITEHYRDRSDESPEESKPARTIPAPAPAAKAVGQDFVPAKPTPKEKEPVVAVYEDADVYKSFSQTSLDSLGNAAVVIYDTVTSKNFRKSMLIVGGALLVFLAIFWLSTQLVPHSQQSGEFYNNGLRKFAPDRFNRKLPGKPGWPYK